MRRPQVAQAADLARLDEDLEVQRRQGLLVPFAVRYVRVSPAGRESPAPSSQVGREDEAALRVLVAVDDILGFGRAF